MTKLSRETIKPCEILKPVLYGYWMHTSDENERLGYLQYVVATSMEEAKDKAVKFVMIQGLYGCSFRSIEKAVV